MKPPAPRTFGPVTRTDFVRYQGASGDMNPVHHDEEFARNAGFPAPLGVGMFAAGVMASWATDWLGPERVRRVRVRWKSPVFPGDRLTVSGEVVRHYEVDGAPMIDLELAVTHEDGRVAVQGWMTFAHPEDA
jgi:acyl dehydratase